MTHGRVCPLLAKYRIEYADNVHLDADAMIVNDWPQAKLCTEKCTRKECWEIEHQRRDCK